METVHVAGMGWQNAVYALQLNAHKGLYDAMKCVPNTMVQLLPMAFMQFMSAFLETDTAKY